jgi:hypothetical protein
MALAGVAFAVLATLACVWADVRPPAAALAAALGWAWTATAVLTPAIAAELAFSRGEHRRITLPPGESQGGGVSIIRVSKDRVLPMALDPFPNEQEVLFLDGPSREDSGPRRLEALQYARHHLPGALATASIVSALVAVVTALFLLLASQLRLGVTLVCAAATALLVGTEKLRLLVAADRRARDDADDRAPRPSVTTDPGAALEFGGAGHGGEQLLVPGNRPEGTAATPSRTADDDTDEVWE